MSATTTQTAAKPTTKKSSKDMPLSSQKASKFYPVEDERQPKKARKVPRPTNLRPSLQPGTIVILLAGRFRGKRVVVLNALPEGVLLVTGPFKANGVPLRRVNARYVIATSQKVDLAGVDKSVIQKAGQDGYFTKDKPKKDKSEEAFFKQGEKPEAKKIASSRVEDQKAVDKALLANIKKTPYLLSYLHSTFSLRKGDKPHEMKF